MKLTSNGGVFSVWLPDDLRTRLFALAGRGSEGRGNAGMGNAGAVARHLLREGIEKIERRARQRKTRKLV